MKHTAGQWKYFNDNSHKNQGTFTVYVEGDGAICDLINTRSKDTQEANAKLIAASPLLLEALIHAYSHMVIDTNYQGRNLLQTMQAAIKAATGIDN